MEFLRGKPNRPPLSTTMPILTDNERLGTVVGANYAIESIIGRGGMGTIFSAKHKRTGRSVAIKILHPQFVRDPIAVHRFLNEARAVASFRHPNVVEVLDVDQLDDTTVFMVLAKLTGESLGDRLDKQRTVTPTEAIEYLLPVMRALSVAHARGVIHRDLKPDNIFLAKDDTGSIVPTLLDFGIAKTIDSPDASVQTMTGTMIGTPQYMAPEQATDSKQADHLVDIYALGVVWFECLAGQRPIDGASPAIIIGKLLSSHPPKLKTVAPWVPDELASVIDHAIAFQRDDRIQSMDDFIDDISNAAKQLGLTVAHPSVLPEPLAKLDVTAKIAAVRASVETLQENGYVGERKSNDNISARYATATAAAASFHEREPRPNQSAKTSLLGLVVALTVAGGVAIAITKTSTATTAPGGPSAPAPTRASQAPLPQPTAVQRPVAPAAGLTPTSNNPSAPSALPGSPLQLASNVDAGALSAPSANQLQLPMHQAISAMHRSGGRNNVDAVVAQRTIAANAVVAPPVAPPVAQANSAQTPTQQSPGSAPANPSSTQAQPTSTNRPPAVASEW